MEPDGKLVDFILKNLGGNRISAEIGPEDDLIGAGLIDSLGILKLIGFLEEHYAVSISDDDLTPENFGSISSISALLQGKLSSAGAL